MTRAPRGRFESLIIDFLDGKQRTNENVQSRFERQDERDFAREQTETAQDFAREQYDTARRDQQSDIMRERDWMLTDRAAQNTSAALESIRNVMPFLDEASMAQAEALVTALSQPHGLQGQAALDWITNLNVDVNGNTVNLASSLATWQSQADRYIRNEDFELELAKSYMPHIGNTALPYETRLGYLNVLLGSKLLGETIKNQAMDLLEVDDPEARQAALDEGRLLTAKADAATTEASMLEVDAEFQRAFLEGDKAAMEDAARARQQEMGLNDAAAFWQMGLLPEDEDARRVLANQVAAGRMDALEALADTNQYRYARTLEANTRTAELGVDLAAVDLKVANYDYDRAALLDDLEDAVAIAERARAAVLVGDLGTLNTLKALQESGAYDSVLGDLDLDSFIQEARDINQTGAAERTRVRQRVLLEGKGDIAEFVAGIAASFTLDDLEMGHDGSFEGLEAAVDAELKRLSDNDLLALGVSREQLREQLLQEGERALRATYRSDAQAVLSALEAAIPGENDPDRALWEATYLDHLMRLGVEEDAANALVAGLLTSANREEATWRATTTRTWQEADLLYQQTVGQYISNVRDQYALDAMLEGGATMTIEQFRQLQGMYGDIAQASQDMVNSGACGIPSAETQWVAGTAPPLTFTPEAPGCQQALDDANSARAMMSSLANQATFGADGVVYLGGSQAGFDPGRPPEFGEARDAPYVTVSEVAQGFQNHEHDAGSFDEGLYLNLPYDFQRTVMGFVNRGASPEEVNAAMAEAAFIVAVGDGRYVVPDSTKPSLVEAGLARENNWQGGSPVTIFDSDEWFNLPTARQVELVTNTREWEERVADMANLEAVDPDYAISDLSDAAIAKLAEDFGILAPWRKLEQEGVTLPPWVLANARRGVMREDGTVGPPIEGSFTGNYRMNNESFPIVRDPGIAETREALERTVAELHQRAAEWLRGEIEADVATREAAQRSNPAPEADTTATGARTSPTLAPPGQATATGSGGTGDYSSLASGSTQGRTPAANVKPSTPEEIESAPPVEDWTPPPVESGRPFAEQVPLAETLLPHLIRQESGGRHQVASGELLTSGAGARGITQVMPGTGSSPGFGVKPLQNDSVEEYVRFGRDYLAALLHYYNGVPEYALAAYNAGAGNVDEALKAAKAAGNEADFLNHLPTAPENQAQTQRYVANIMSMAGLR